MKAAKPMVLLFEDDAARGDEISTAIKRAFGTHFRFKKFEQNEGKPAGGAYEDELLELIRKAEFSGLSLVVTDRDLSKSDRFPGLSEAVVSKVAGRLGLPVCVYATGRDDSVIERQRSGGDGRIILDAGDIVRMGKKIRILVEGFAEINQTLKSAQAVPRKGNRFSSGLGAILAKVLRAPEVVDHLSLYASGDQRMIAELMPVGGSKVEINPSAVLGTWLYDSVLSFPGLMVDEVSAASFLNIRPKEFAEKKLRDLFSDSQYCGPFSDPSEPRWWRHRLADLLAVMRRPLGSHKCRPNGSRRDDT